MRPLSPWCKEIPDVRFCQGTMQELFLLITNLCDDTVSDVVVMICRSFSMLVGKCDEVMLGDIGRIHELNWRRIFVSCMYTSVLSQRCNNPVEGCKKRFCQITSNLIVLLPFQTILYFLGHNYSSPYHNVQLGKRTYTIPLVLSH